MSKFTYPLPNGDVFTLTLDTHQWSDPEIQKILLRIQFADVLYSSLKELMKEMAPINLIAQSDHYTEAQYLLSLLD